jgi:hypothetical protein
VIRHNTLTNNWDFGVSMYDMGDANLTGDKVTQNNLGDNGSGGLNIVESLIHAQHNW